MNTPDLEMHMPLRLPGALRYRGSSGCQRPNCRQPGVITLNWNGIVLTFCSDHAEDKAGQPTAILEWLSPLYDVCPTCARVLPHRLLRQVHFNLAGNACPPISEQS